MNARTCPPRASKVSAVLTTSRGVSPRARPFGVVARRRGSGSCGAKGSTGASRSSSSGSVSGNAPRGRRAVRERRLAGLRRIGQQRIVVPQALAVGAPENPERPARQRFARIPLALTLMQQPARREARFQTTLQRLREFAFLGRRRDI